MWSPPLPPGRGHAGALSRRRHPRDTAAQIRSVSQTWHMDTPHLFACKCADANPALSHPYLPPRHRRAPWPRAPVAWRTGAHWRVGRTYHLTLSLSLFHSSNSFPPTARPSSSSAHTSRPTWSSHSAGAAPLDPSIRIRNLRRPAAEPSAPRARYRCAAVCAAGDLVIYDTRVMHRGGPNGSDADRHVITPSRRAPQSPLNCAENRSVISGRPMVYLTFSRVWYRDTLNP